MQKTNSTQLKLFIYYLVTTLFFATSCEKEKDSQPAGEYEKGVFIINEGNFGSSNGEISYYNKSSKTVTNKLFETVNNRPLGGDVVQSYFIYDNQGFIICNNSKKIEIVDANTFESKGVINNLLLPRYMIAVNNKGYVSEWVNFGSKGRVAIIDLATNTVTKTIEVGMLPEQLAIVNDKLFVANSDENTISIINLANQTLEHTITVADSPKDFQIDSNQKLWVLCGGKTDYSNPSASTPGALVRINPSTLSTELSLTFPTADVLEDLQINGQRNKLYYSYAGAVYTHDISATGLGSTPFIKRSFYGIGIDPAEDILYGAVASFTSDGKVIRYNSTGTALDSVTVTIGPNGFVFK